MIFDCDPTLLPCAGFVEGGPELQSLIPTEPGTGSIVEPGVELEMVEREGQVVLGVVQLEKHCWITLPIRRSSRRKPREPGAITEGDGIPDAEMDLTDGSIPRTGLVITSTEYEHKVDADGRRKNAQNENWKKLKYTVRFYKPTFSQIDVEWTKHVSKLCFPQSKPIWVNRANVCLKQSGSSGRTWLVGYPDPEAVWIIGRKERFAKWASTFNLTAFVRFKSS